MLASGSTLRKKLEEEHRIELKTFPSLLIGLSDVAIGSLALLPTDSAGQGRNPTGQLST